MDAFQRSANFQADAIVLRPQRLVYAGTPAPPGLWDLVTGILALFHEEAVDHARADSLMVVAVAGKPAAKWTQ